MKKLRLRDLGYDTAMETRALSPGCLLGSPGSYDTTSISTVSFSLSSKNISILCWYWSKSDEAGKHKRH